MRLVISALVMTAAIGFASPADALVLCAPKKGVGALKVREACKKKETRIDPATVGLVGPPGPQGPQGNQGEQGPQGPGGPLTDYEIVELQQTVFVDNSGAPSGLSEVVTLSCPEGKHVIGGGASIADTEKGAQRDIRIAMSRPNHDGTGWQAQLFNANVMFGLNADLKLRAICAVSDEPILPLD